MESITLILYDMSGQIRFHMIKCITVVDISHICISICIFIYIHTYKSNVISACQDSSTMSKIKHCLRHENKVNENNIVIVRHQDICKTS